jgi:hypothetical protein
MTCACGFEPLVSLQSEIGNDCPRLKYFMDPKVKGTDEPNDIALFHSKLVYLFLPATRTSVIYVGSHNWTSRALGPGKPRNAEASIRYELPFSDEHLLGQGTSLASQVNRHLIAAYKTPACLPATSANLTTFEQWFQWTCKNAPQSGLEPTTILLAVRKDDGTTVTPSQWAELKNHGIYLPSLVEEEGQSIRESVDRILVMVWPGKSDLAAGNQPILLRCHLSTQDPGERSQVRGTNQARSPIEGFQAVFCDEKHLMSLQQSAQRDRNVVGLWTGREAEYFDFIFPSPHSASSSIDRGVKPIYRFLLEVDDVIFPEEGVVPEEPELLWARSSFAVAQSLEQAKLERVPGYAVSADVSSEIIAFFENECQVELARAKTLPVSDYDDSRDGRRVSAHALHDTFISSASRAQKADFYERTKRGRLVAELDEQLTAPAIHRAELFPTPELVRRVNRLYTSKVDALKQEWFETAREYRAGRRESE